ncbi:MAG TPA: hypothetical protein VIF62_03895 [Labilithrix sp.]|jgi:hypothetical protein
MKKLPLAVVVLVGCVSAVNVASTGCGSDETADITDDGGSESSNNPPGAPPPGSTDGSFLDVITDGGRDGDAFACTGNGDTCASGAECCTGNCGVPDGGGGKVCEPPVGGCVPTGTMCPADPTKCCQGACLGGVCGKCVDNNGSCATSADCCGGGSCVPDGKGGGICQAVNCSPAPCVPTCKTAGNSCAMDNECCGGFCNMGVCGSASSTCTQVGDVCIVDAECCGGVCNKAAGATFGTCKNIGTSVTGGPCLPAGEKCTPEGTCTGASCCSRSCVPDPVSGLGVCASETGCHLIGDLCKTTNDCCGVKDQPGSVKNNGGMQSTDVQCIISAGATFGVCDYVVTVCSPAGALCKPGNATIGGAMSCSTKTDCCAGNDNQDPTCQIDTNGIPRCTVTNNLDCDAGPVPPPGTACGSSADCCGGPCLPNASGSPPFVCGGAKCEMAGTTCTSDADCCTGLPCVKKVGAASGICGGTILPDGGISDAGGTDGGGNLPDGGTCSLYGQTCVVAGDCCNSVPCTNGTCHFP